MRPNLAVCLLFAVLVPASALAQESPQSPAHGPSSDGACDTADDCDQDSACLAGQCTAPRGFQRVEVLVEGVPITFGNLRLVEQSSSPPLIDESFVLRGGLGFVARASWTIGPRWLLGFYVGYWRLRDGHLDIDKASVPEGVSVGDIRLRLLRTGFLAAYRWPVHRTFTCGISLETGALVGTSGNAGIGAEIEPDFFFDFPLSTGVRRWWVTLSLGVRTGLTNHTLNPPGGYWEVWSYVMPVIRLGVGFGR